MRNLLIIFITLFCFSIYAQIPKSKIRTFEFTPEQWDGIKVLENNLNIYIEYVYIYNTYNFKYEGDEVFWSELSDYFYNKGLSLKVSYSRKSKKTYLIVTKICKN